MENCLIPGREFIKKYDGFKLIGRDEDFRTLCSILMRSKANSVILLGAGGVGCTAMCLGIQEAKNNPETSFDIISKRIFWLDTDGLFASSDSATINADFQKAMNILYNTPESILIIEDTRDFIEAARNSGSSHFINALVLAVKLNMTQVILEVRDDDLELVLRCHSDMKESFTLMDLQEPSNGSLKEIVVDSVSRLEKFHEISVDPLAIDTAIELTNKYRTRDMGLNRAQPDRSVTLLDRSLSTYRLNAHKMPANLSPEAEAQWKVRHGEIKKVYDEQRQVETLIIELQQKIIDQENAEKANSATVSNPLQSVESSVITDYRKKISLLNIELGKYRAHYSELTDPINATLKLKKEDVLLEFSLISGIPVTKLNEDERVKLRNLEENINKRIFGQTEVVRSLANAIKTARVGRRNSDKPQASFMFLGPSGVGKTELAKVLAACLMDDEKALTRFDMSEYMEKHAVAKLIGAPPGYEGFEQGGILTNTMRQNPVRILLFDEIEKAHPDVFNIFLSILSDGRLTDNVGRTVSFGDAIILMTTNIGQPHFLDPTISFEEAEVLAKKTLSETYRSEFLNRFAGWQNIICFRKLGVVDIEKIVRREITNIDMAYQEKGINTVMNDESLNNFCIDHYDPSIGARGLPGYITANLEPFIVNSILDNETFRGTMNVNYDKVTKKFDVSLIENP